MAIQTTEIQYTAKVIVPVLLQQIIGAMPTPVDLVTSPRAIRWFSPDGSSYDTVSNKTLKITFENTEIPESNLKAIVSGVIAAHDYDAALAYQISVGIATINRDKIKQIYPNETVAFIDTFVDIISKRTGLIPQEVGTFDFDAFLVKYKVKLQAILEGND